MHWQKYVSKLKLLIRVRLSSHQDRKVDRSITFFGIPSLQEILPFVHLQNRGEERGDIESKKKKRRSKFSKKAAKSHYSSN